MASTYKLTYFNIAALGEPARLIMSYGKMDFEDNRVTLEQWPVIKPTTPYGQLPILEYNGKIAHQSVSICRYLAKQAKLTGQNDWENLEIDSAVDTLSDFRAKIAVYYYEKDETIKEKRKGPLFDEILPFYTGKIEAQIKKNNGYLAVERLTWADLYFIGILSYLNKMLGEDLMEKIPGLKELKEKVEDIPAIKEYLEKRPQTEI